jgi:hypothetical protein
MENFKSVSTIPTIRRATLTSQEDSEIELTGDGGGGGRPALSTCRLWDLVHPTTLTEGGRVYEKVRVQEVPSRSPNHRVQFRLVWPWAGLCVWGRRELQRNRRLGARECSPFSSPLS